ncbi:MAG: CidA/LrgA family protein [Paracoccaceae bacterium]
MIFFLTLIFACQLVGELITAGLGLPLPGPVLGMAILFAGLCLRGLPDALGRVADALIGHLSLLFVPAGVGVMVHAGLLGRDALPLARALVGSTLLTVAFVGLLAQWIGGRGDGGQDDGARGDGGRGDGR